MLTTRPTVHYSCCVLSSQDYVCVLDLDWFELTLRLCNTAQFEEESHKVCTQKQMKIYFAYTCTVYMCDRYA